MSIAEYQLLNKVLSEKSYSIIEDNLLTEEHFAQAKEEFNYIVDFYKKYKAIPDKEKFSSEFTEFKYFKVNQPIKSIVDDLREQVLFQRSVSVINGSTKLFEQDANKGVKYLLAHLDELQPSYELSCVDIMHDKTRLEEWKQRQIDPESVYIPLPFKELEETLFGYQRGEELFLWLAKSGVGKTQVLSMSVEKASKAGYRVALVSPELRTSTIAYRIDSSRTHMSNTAMQRGLLLPEYEKYFETICKSDEHIFVADSNDFEGDITVQQCKNFVKQTKADILFIDGLVYVRPDGWTPKMTMTDMMGEVGKQLFTFSTSAGIPVVAVAQAQRNKRQQDEDDISDSTNIFGSYQLAQASTRIVSINRVASALKLCVVKNRYGKDTNAEKSDGFVYNFDFDRMLITYIPSLDEVKKDKVQEDEVQEAKEKFKHIF